MASEGAKELFEKATASLLGCHESQREKTNDCKVLKPNQTRVKEKQSFRGNVFFLVAWNMNMAPRGLGR